MENLKGIQTVQLKALQEVDRICKENNLEYFLFGGTLLGAVRHKGFIPWDDDLDIGMLREDYERFIEICKSQLDNQYFLQTAQTDDFPFPMCKIRVNNTTFIEKLMLKNKNMHQGIFIDIFPFDKVPSDKNKIYERIISILYNFISIKNLYIYNYNNYNLLKKIIVIVVKITGYFVPNKLLLYIFNHLSIRYNCSNSKSIGETSHAKPYSVCYNLEDIFPLKKIEFEGQMFMAPNNSIKCLEIQYGDFMKLPSKEDRVPKHGYIVDLNTDYKDYIK